MAIYRRGITGKVDMEGEEKGKREEGHVKMKGEEGREGEDGKRQKWRSKREKGQMKVEKEGSREEAGESSLRSALSGLMLNESLRNVKRGAACQQMERRRCRWREREEGEGMEASGQPGVVWRKSINTYI